MNIPVTQVTHRDHQMTEYKKNMAQKKDRMKIGKKQRKLENYPPTATHYNYNMIFQALFFKRKTNNGKAIFFKTKKQTLIFFDNSNMFDTKIVYI